MAGSSKSLVYLGLVEDDEFEEMPEYEEGQVEAVERPTSRRAMREEAEVASIQAVPSKQVRMHMVEPKSFNDAEQIGQKFKVGYTGDHQSAAGRRRALQRGSSISRAALLTAWTAASSGWRRKVFLLSPHNVEVSAEDKRWLREKGFFNQF